MATNELDDCLQELQEAKTETTGKREFVLIEGKDYSALILPNTMAGVFVSGGEAESGGFSCIIRKALFSEPPEQGSDIRQGADGRKLSILSVVEVNDASYEVLAGDAASEGR